MSKNVFLKGFMAALILSVFWSCSRTADEVDTNPTLELKTFKNLHAPQEGGRGEPVSGAFTKYSFATNSVVNDDSWDVAFRGTTIIINGGSKIGLTDEPNRTGNGAVSVVNSTLDSVKEIPSSATFKQDQQNSYAIPTSSGAGWYSYNMDTHLIAPIAGKVFVVKTHDGKYAKFEIISYYKDAPTKVNPLEDESSYYTFRYVYQNSGTKF